MASYAACESKPLFRQTRETSWRIPLTGARIPYRRFLTDIGPLQVLRFLFVGGTAFLIYFILEFLLEGTYLRPYGALTIAYATATAYHFLMNRYFTFRSSSVDGGISTTLLRYVSVVVLNYAITLIVVTIAASAYLRTQVGMLAAVVLTTIVSFVLSKTWIFKPPRRGLRAEEMAE
jgi:putative flippase GtrA